MVDTSLAGTVEPSAAAAFDGTVRVAVHGDGMNVALGITASSIVLGDGRGLAGLGGLVEALGADHFGERLLSYLHETCGADHCAVFQLDRDALDEIATGSIDGTGTAHRQAARYVAQEYWRRDPVIPQVRHCLAQSRPLLLRVRIDELGDLELRDTIYPNIRERIVVAGRSRDAAYGLSILRAGVHEAFSEQDVARIGGAAEILLPLLAKHADLLLHKPDLTGVLASLGEIESCLVAMTTLPRREVEVCARILHGLSTAGMSLDLNVGAESVKTYRKRAYQRLEIGSERELLTWYLGLWSRWHRTAGRARGPRDAHDVRRRRAFGRRPSARSARRVQYAVSRSASAIGGS